MFDKFVAKVGPVSPKSIVGMYSFSINIQGVLLAFHFDSYYSASIVYRYWYGINCSFTPCDMIEQPASSNIFFTQNDSNQGIFINDKRNLVDVLYGSNFLITFFLVVIRGILPSLCKDDLFLQGCFFKWEERGYLLLGNSGAGKSYLINMLSTDTRFSLVFEDYGVYSFLESRFLDLGEKCLKLKKHDYVNISDRVSFFQVGDQRLYEIKELFKLALDFSSSFELIILADRTEFDVNAIIVYEEISKERSVKFGQKRFMNESILDSDLELYCMHLRKLIDRCLSMHLIESLKEDTCANLFSILGRNENKLDISNYYTT